MPDEHDDPGHVTWGWKDGLLGKRRWYYGRVLRKRNTLISLDMLPYFYALSPNYGDPDEDYLIDYETGPPDRWRRKLMYEALLNLGPLDTIALRKNAGLTSRSADTEFNRALDELQTTFRILPVGVSEVGRLALLVYLRYCRPSFPRSGRARARHQRAGSAPEDSSRCYLASVGAAPFKEIQRMFGNQPHELAEVQPSNATCARWKSAARSFRGSRWRD